MFSGALMKKVLIIEDDKNINEMLQELLSNNGYNVSSAYSGTEALLIHNKQIDLIVLDLMLPGKNGEEIIKKLKTINDVPIIITTAINDIDKKLDLFELGADDYITKPFNNAELLARIKVHLRKTNTDSKDIITIDDVETNKLNNIVNIVNDLLKDKIKIFEFKENNNRAFASFELKEPLSTKESIFLKGKINKEVYHLEIDNGDNTKSTIEIHLKNPLEKDLTLEKGKNNNV